MLIMKEWLNNVKSSIENRDYVLMICLVSIVLYVLSLFMHTGIGVETGREDFPGWFCLMMGWLTIFIIPYFLLWISNYVFLYTVVKLVKKKITGRIVVFIFVSFILTLGYICIHRYSWKSDYRNYACYVWSLSYMLVLWASVIEWLKDTNSFIRNIWVNVFFALFGIGILVALVSERKYYNDLLGESINPNIEVYRRNYKGVYYAFSTRLFSESEFDYLEGADADSMVILNDQFAKDHKHVWNYNELMKGVDVKTFTVSKTGVPKDKNHVYIYTYISEENTSRYIPMSDSIDIATAEYFIPNDDTTLVFYDDDWIRDSRHVFHNGHLLQGANPKTFKKQD